MKYRKSNHKDQTQGFHGITEFYGSTKNRAGIYKVRGNDIDIILVIIWLHEITPFGLLIGPPTQNDIAGTVNGAVDHFFLTEGGINDFAISGIDPDMADIHISVIHLKGIEDQISW